jgi:hypothetical protein
MREGRETEEAREGGTREGEDLFYSAHLRHVRTCMVGHRSTLVIWYFCETPYPLAREYTRAHVNVCSGVNMPRDGDAPPKQGHSLGSGVRLRQSLAYQTSRRRTIEGFVGTDSVDREGLLSEVAMCGAGCKGTRGMQAASQTPTGMLRVTSVDQSHCRGIHRVDNTSWDCFFFHFTRYITSAFTSAPSSLSFPTILRRSRSFRSSTAGDVKR